MAQRVEASRTTAVIYEIFSTATASHGKGRIERVSEPLHTLILNHPRLLVSSTPSSGSSIRGLEHRAVLIVTLLRLSLQHYLTLFAHFLK